MFKVVKAFKEGAGPGPNLKDLHFDTSRGLTSAWNKKAFDLICIDFCSKNRKDRNFPSRSNHYFAKLIEDRFKRLWKVWKAAQPRTDSDGSIENFEEVESRMVQSKVAELKASRITMRRLEVSTVHSSCDV